MNKYIHKNPKPERREKEKKEVALEVNTALRRRADDINVAMATKSSLRYGERCQGNPKLQHSHCSGPGAFLCLLLLLLTLPCCWRGSGLHPLPCPSSKLLGEIFHFSSLPLFLQLWHMPRMMRDNCRQQRHGDIAGTTSHLPSTDSNVFMDAQSKLLASTRS